METTRAKRRKTTAAGRPPRKTLDAQLLRRIVIEDVLPQVDGGRFPVKRIVGDEVTITADIFADGHDVLAAALLYRRAGEADWRETPMTPGDNDRWSGRFVVDALG